MVFFFFSSRRRHTRCLSDWSSDVCSSDLRLGIESEPQQAYHHRRHHEPFPWRQVGELPTLCVWALESALHHPQRIKSGRENSETCDHGNCDADLIGTK